MRLSINLVSLQHLQKHFTLVKQKTVSNLSPSLDLSQNGSFIMIFYYFYLKDDFFSICKLIDVLQNIIDLTIAGDINIQDYERQPNHPDDECSAIKIIL